MKKLITKKRITYGIGIIVFVILWIILAVVKPSEESMTAQCSPELRKQIERIQTVISEMKAVD